jgi:predicted enzyme related to lactoylglutathione lyase
MLLEKKFDEGVICWVDLGSTDLKRTKEFYCKLFNWSAHDFNVPGAGTYTTFKYEGKNVAAAYEIVSQQAQGKAFPFWMSYVAVDNVEASVKKAEALGGVIVLSPTDVDNRGKMAVVKDPTGAVFALWEAKSFAGIELCHVPCSLAWNELYTTDTSKANDFYTKLFNWEVDTVPMPVGVYTNFKIKGNYVCGMLQINEYMGPIPSNWAVYFQVKNCDETAKSVVELGGKILIPPTDLPNGGRIATVQDPAGVIFSIQHGIHE